ncbi:hypothetical protein [Reyranella sp.]|uniref:hypothetical protein n=1 Tax=Reyranella sp. TaxID=1929291 RepID=UPI003D140830
MAATSHPHGRVGAGHRAKLKKWSDKVAREDEAQVAAASAKRPAVRRQRPLDVAKEKLRKLFH